MNLTDSHAHLDFYDPAERLEVLRRAYAAGVRTVLAIGIGQGPEEMHQALAIAHELAARGEAGSGEAGLPRVFASAGIHPEQAHHATAEALGKLAALVADERCVAVGEIGLDYYHFGNPEIATQQQAFVAQMRAAAAAAKPILIHCRTSELATPEAKVRYGEADAWEDLLGLIEEHWRGRQGVMHCFSGSVDQARRSVAAGFHLSFAGNLTYPKAQGIREAAAVVPLERLLVETDCPFLAPAPHRGARNEPALMTATAAVLAALRGISPEELARLTTRNFEELFPATREMGRG